MLRRPFVIVAVLFGLDYLVWLWSLGGSRGAVGMVAGPLLVILGFALLWLALKQLAKVLTSSTRRSRSGPATRQRADAAATVRYREGRVATSVSPEDGASPGFDEPATVSSGSSPSSAQIAA